MTYYETLEEDLKRAKQILADGKLKPEDVDDIPEELRQGFIDHSGSINVIDIYAAYKILESLVQKIENTEKHTYYMVRHKATGEFMPELKRGRGYSHWNPSKVDTANHFGRRKLIGVPRLFPSWSSAYRTIVQWNALPNSYNGFRSGPFGSDEYEIQTTNDGRSKDDLEVVEVNIEVIK